MRALRVLAALALLLTLGSTAPPRSPTAAPQPQDAAVTVRVAPMPMLTTATPSRDLRGNLTEIRETVRNVHPETDEPLQPNALSVARQSPEPSITEMRHVAAVVSAGRATATWYCLAGVSRCTAGFPETCLCAAISPDLSQWMGHLIRVCAGACVTVRAVDCDCAAVRSIDVYAAAFRWLAPLSMGEVMVSLEVIQ